MSKVDEAANSLDVADHFSNRSKDWDSLYEREEFKQRIHKFETALAKWVPNQANILDYGCGTGAISFKLAKKGYKVTGIDVAPGMVEQANQKKGDGLDLEFSILPADLATAFPQKFDAIVCSSVIEYIEDDLKLLKDFSQILKPGGYLIISIPNAYGFLTGLQRISSKILHSGNKTPEDSAFRRHTYRRGEFKAKLADASMQYMGSDYFAIPRLSSVNKMLDGKKISRYLGTLELVVAKSNT